jgi:hypothetical protein
MDELIVLSILPVTSEIENYTTYTCCQIETVNTKNDQKQ